MSQLLRFVPGRLLRSKSFSPFIQSRTYATPASAIPQYLLNIPPTKTTALSNGIVVATEEQAIETATVGLWINTGSMYETEKNNGVAHFLEHMAFKGTSKRSQKALELEVENIGASLNAYTSREQTVYTAKSFKSQVPITLDIIADIVQNSELSEENVERERSTIIREKQEVENNTEEVIFDYVHSAAFQGSSLGRTILGSEENIRSISRGDLQDFIKTHYTGPRMVLVAAGGVKHENIVELAQKHFGGLSSTDHLTESIPVDYIGSDIRVRNDDMPLAHVALAVEGITWSDPDFFTVQVIQAMLGSWDRSIGSGANISSYMCEMIAVDKLAHSVMSFNTCYGTSGLIGNYAIAPPDKLDLLTGRITDEWQRIANSSTANEVDRAKNKVKSASMLALDGTSQVAEDIGRQMLSIGRRISAAEVFLRVNDVTLADVRRVAKRIFTDVSPTVIGIGPIRDLPDYNTIRGWTYWNRL